MLDYERLRKELVRDEGLRLTAYRCTSGKLTIGVGRNLDDVGLTADEYQALGLTPTQMPKARLTEAQAMFLLFNDIARCETQLDTNLPWWRTLDGVRQRVLVNMCFNLGIKRLLGFRNTLEFIRRGDYPRAARNMLASKWARQVKGRATRLAEMMATGKTIG